MICRHASQASTGGYMTVMMGRGQYFPINKEPSVHKYWSVTWDQAAAHQIGSSFPLASLKSRVLPLTPHQTTFVSSDEEWNVMASNALSLHLLFPHMTRWGVGCISHISHLELKHVYWWCQDLYRANHVRSTNVNTVEQIHTNETCDPNWFRPQHFVSMRKSPEMPVLSPKLDKSSLKASPSHSKWELIRFKIQKLLTLQLWVPFKLTFCPESLEPLTNDYI